MKKSSALAALFAIFVFLMAGCKTTRFYVPGEKKEIIENFYSEYYNIAEEYFKVKNYTKAAEFYMKASSSEQLHNAALYNAGRSYGLAKDWNKALEIYLEAETHDAENIEVKQGLAYIYAMTGDFEKSEELYNSLLEKNPDISDILVNYTILLLTQEKYNEAKSRLEEIKQKFPDEKKIKDIEEKITAWEESQKTAKDDSDKIPDELKRKRKKRD